MLASRSVLHPVQEVELGVNRNGDLHGCDGEGFARATGDFGTALRVGGDRSHDAFALKEPQHPVFHLM